jgi:protoporphyrinogen oxidase
MPALDAIVLGAGPAGLGAALALARGGARVELIEAADHVGGLCATRRRDGVAYDIGGHIPFVRSEARLSWLRDLVGDDLQWVPRPVRSLHGSALHAGRYLDQPPEGPPDGMRDDDSALAWLAARVGVATVEARMRRYLEKIDGVRLEEIPADRARRLTEDQAAPDGFWFPRAGIGQLMDAMAGAARAEGAVIHTGTRVEGILTTAGRAAGVRVRRGVTTRLLRAPRIVVAMPAEMAARMLEPAPPPEALPTVRMRAVCIVYLDVVPRQPFADAWVQVDAPEVPFARLFAPANWSAAMVPGDRSVFGCECYCQAEGDDPIWGREDADLAAWCLRALTDRLGWVDRDARAGTLEVLRLPRAYPVPDRAQGENIAAPGRFLEELAGVHLAPGAAVIEATEGGERAAAQILGAAAAAA